MKPEVLRIGEVCEMLGLSRTTIWRLSRSPTSSFPTALKLTGKAIGYLRVEVEEWLRSRPPAA